MKNSLLILFSISTLQFSYSQTATGTVDLNTTVMQNSPLLLGITYDCRSSLSDPLNGLTGYHNTDGTFIAEVDAIFGDFPFSTLRYPANGIMQGFEWKKSVGDISVRTAQQVFASQSTPAQVLEFGFDEFMEMTISRGVDPEDVQIMVPIYDPTTIGLSPTQLKAAVPNVASSNGDWVEYCNAPNDGSNINGGIDWAAERALNGREEPYGIKIWNMGNEPYTNNEFGSSGADSYINTILPIIDSMLAADPTIQITVTITAKITNGNWTDIVINSPLLQGKIYGVNNHFFLTEELIAGTIPTGLVSAEAKLAGVAIAAAQKGYKLIVGDGAHAVTASAGAPTQAEQDIAMQWQGANLTADFLLMLSQIDNIERSDYWVYGTTAAQWHPIRKNSNGSYSMMPTASLYKLLNPIFLDHSLAVTSTSTVASDGNSYSVRSSAFASSDQSSINVIAVNRDKTAAQTYLPGGLSGYYIVNAKVLNAASLDAEVIDQTIVGPNSFGYYDIPAMGILVLEYSNNTTVLSEQGIDATSNSICYPNPAKDELHIDFKVAQEKQHLLQIIDLTGNVIRDLEFPFNSNITISTSSLPAGSYILKISTKQEVEYKNLVINR